MDQVLFKFYFLRIRNLIPGANTKSVFQAKYSDGRVSQSSNSVTLHTLQQPTPPPQHPHLLLLFNHSTCYYSCSTTPPVTTPVPTTPPVTTLFSTHLLLLLFQPPHLLLLIFPTTQCYYFSSTSILWSTSSNILTYNNYNVQLTGYSLTHVKNYAGFNIMLQSGPQHDTDCLVYFNYYNNFVYSNLVNVAILFILR